MRTFVLPKWQGAVGLQCADAITGKTVGGFRNGHGRHMHPSGCGSVQQSCPMTGHRLSSTDPAHPVCRSFRAIVARNRSRVVWP